MHKIPAAIVGPGNIGTDLMYKLLRSELVEPRYMVGVDPDSAGLKLAREAGLETSSDGVDWLLERPELPQATSAYVHVRNAPRYKKAGIYAVDLTPAARGPYVVPPVNLLEHVGENSTGAMNVNMVTCGGQATIPIVYAVSRVVPVDYAEIVATVSSASAGPGTRNNIDEFTRTTAKAGAPWDERMADACAVLLANEAAAQQHGLVPRARVLGMDQEGNKSVIRVEVPLAEVQTYVPGYHLRGEPQFDTLANGTARVATFIEVQGAGDFLPPYAGNLDIMTAAAAKVGNEIARHLLRGTANDNANDNRNANDNDLKAAVN